MSFASEWFFDPRFAVAATGSGVIKVGEASEAVKVLQLALIQLGYALPQSTDSQGNVDGIFGSETDRKVKEFQRRSLPHETPDGKVGPKTLDALDRKLIGIRAPFSRPNVVVDGPTDRPSLAKGVDIGVFVNGMSAVRQPHADACWATCLAFWAQACGGGRMRLRPGEIIAKYQHLASASGAHMGGMPTRNLVRILSDLEKPGNMLSPHEPIPIWNAFVWEPFDAQNLNYTWLKANTGPRRLIYFGYKVNGNAHINVITHYDLEGHSYVLAMEPRTGTFKLREIEYYRQSTHSLFAVPN